LIRRRAEVSVLYDVSKTNDIKQLIAISYEPLNPGDKAELTFEEVLHKNRKKRERALGDKSSRSSAQGSDAMIASRLE
jgi:hypothetical protein